MALGMRFLLMVRRIHMVTGCQASGKARGAQCAE